MRFCLRAQVKIAWSFYQVATLIPVVYLVQLPTQVEEALDIFRISIELEAYNIHISASGRRSAGASRPRRRWRGAGVRRAVERMQRAGWRRRRRQGAGVRRCSRRGACARRRRRRHGG